MVKSETSETRRDAEILVRNPSPRRFGKKPRDSRKVKTNHAKTRHRDLSKTLPRFRDPAKIFRDPRFSRYHSSPLKLHSKARNELRILRYAVLFTFFSLLNEIKIIILCETVIYSAKIIHQTMSRHVSLIRLAKATLRRFTKETDGI